MVGLNNHAYVVTEEDLYEISMEDYGYRKVNTDLKYNKNWGTS